MKPTARSYVAATPAFRAGTDSPRAFLDRCLQQVEQTEPQIGAFVSLNIPGARAAADRASERWRTSQPLSAIDGMPVGIKDIMETADMPTEQGSPLFAGWRGGRDAAAVAALREAGAVILGKTVTTEFAATEPRGTRNPWDPQRTPGGSSSGSAAAVAAGMLSAALGTQVIGSILRPASYCGCYGFKPSVGAINRGGSFDHFSQSCTGVLAATLDEAWMVSRTISAHAGGDPGFPGLSGPLAPPEPKWPRALALLETAGLFRGDAGSPQRVGAGRRETQLGRHHHSQSGKPFRGHGRRSGDRGRGYAVAPNQRLGSALAAQHLRTRHGPLEAEPRHAGTSRGSRGHELVGLSDIAG